MEPLKMEKGTKVKHIISSIPYCEIFFFVGGTNFLGQIYLGLFYMGTNDHIMSIGGGKVSQMCFMVYNLNIVNLKIFPGHGEKRTCK